MSRLEELETGNKGYPNYIHKELEPFIVNLCKFFDNDFGAGDVDESASGQAIENHFKEI